MTIALCSAVHCRMLMICCLSTTSPNEFTHTNREVNNLLGSCHTNTNSTDTTYLNMIQDIRLTCDYLTGEYQHYWIPTLVTSLYGLGPCEYPGTPVTTLHLTTFTVFSVKANITSWSKMLMLMLASCEYTWKPLHGTTSTESRIHVKFHFMILQDHFS